ncbi:Uncharacterised protein (plasmid) [Tsukamurella tyrosinosolvens]|uniref:Uncharacterized protein n=1 Tax=Tsukamurella tyrosinosolvens TaxID=57704 RepID=A0A1H4UER8_TSUTY|nr:hypothetical protein [Tsukamurella tyrosinosolvens]SEC67133.1 hypothetical protein SAMN04489793_2874 [Tsukamurella tyrosinosolvens]VEH94169.1 Uncharacterised protein [Tsukamurella tyrosinosolvens]
MTRPDPELQATLRRWSVHIDDAGARRFSDEELEQLVREQSPLLPEGVDPTDVVVAIRLQSAGVTTAVQTHGLSLDHWGRYAGGAECEPSRWLYGLAGLTIRAFGLYVPNGYSRNIFDPRANIAAACKQRREHSAQAA